MVNSPFDKKLGSVLFVYGPAVYFYAERVKPFYYFLGERSFVNIDVDFVFDEIFYNFLGEVFKQKLNRMARQNFPHLQEIFIIKRNKGYVIKISEGVDYVDKFPGLLFCVSDLKLNNTVLSVFFCDCDVVFERGNSEVRSANACVKVEKRNILKLFKRCFAQGNIYTGKFLKGAVVLYCELAVKRSSYVAFNSVIGAICSRYECRCRVSTSKELKPRCAINFVFKLFIFTVSFNFKPP